MSDDRRAVVLPDLPVPWSLEFVEARGPMEYVAAATNDQTGDEATGEGETWTEAYAAMVEMIEGEG